MAGQTAKEVFVRKEALVAAINTSVADGGKNVFELGQKLAKIYQKQIRGTLPSTRELEQRGDQPDDKS